VEDFKKIIYAVLAGFAVLMVVWLGFLFFSACGFDFACRRAAALPAMTPIPTLIPATLPAPTRYVAPAGAAVPAATRTPSPDGVRRPSNPGDSGPALDLTGDAAAGETIFAANCAACHGAQGKGGVADPGSATGVVPALNPVEASLKNSDVKIFAYNLDLFIEHGSTPEGPSPVFKMPAWGSSNALTPQQIADVIAYLISLNP
jgi:mono/diheme cytochrome c family protein